MIYPKPIWPAAGLFLFGAADIGLAQKDLTPAKTRIILAALLYKSYIS